MCPCKRGKTWEMVRVVSHLDEIERENQNMITIHRNIQKCIRDISKEGLNKKKRRDYSQWMGQ